MLQEPITRKVSTCQKSACRCKLVMTPYMIPYMILLNLTWIVRGKWPFSSCVKPLFQSVAKCEAIGMEMIFIRMQIKLIFT